MRNYQLCIADIASACDNIDTGEGTGTERLKSIATSVKTNDEIKELSNVDLSYCTQQTKLMAEKNMAERTASSTSVNDIITLDNNNNSGGYVAPYTLVMLIAITIVFAGTYSKGDGYKRGDGMTANKVNYLWPFYLFLCGVSNIEMPTFFPSPNAKDWGDNNSGNANYLEGCLYTILKKAMPLAMIKIMSGVLSYPVAIVSDILLEYFLSGYVDGDGCYSGSFDGKKPASLIIGIKRKNLPIPFTELMKRDLGCRATDEYAFRPLNRKTLYDSHWFIANQLCSTIKRVQVATIIQTAAATQMVNDNYVADETLTTLRCMQTEMLSRANNLHGRAFPSHYYERLFNTMIASSRPLAFNISGAGMFSADGGVGYKLKTCHLIQSSC